MLKSPCQHLLDLAGDVGQIYESMKSQRPCSENLYTVMNLSLSPVYGNCG